MCIRCCLFHEHSIPSILFLLIAVTRNVKTPFFVSFVARNSYCKCDVIAQILEVRQASSCMLVFIICITVYSILYYKPFSLFSSLSLFFHLIILVSLFSSVFLIVQCRRRALLLSQGNLVIKPD